MPQHILISRTDNIGDVVLTLPLCGYLKILFPEVKVSFLCKSYTAPVAEICNSIDQVFLWDQWQQKSDLEIKQLLEQEKIDVVIHVFPLKRFAKICAKAKIPKRIGTAHRFFHWLTCNNLPRFTRKLSSLHESELNFKLLKPLTSEFEIPSVYDMHNYVILKRNNLEKFEKFSDVLSPTKFNLVLHPKSLGSAVDWPVYHFRKLIELLPEDKFNFIISGTAKELPEVEQDILNPLKKRVRSVMGKYSLAEFIEFLSCCDGLVAASTGPLHLASILGLHTLGLFPPQRPMNPMRWMQIGARVSFLTFPKRGGMKDLLPERVKSKILLWEKIPFKHES